MRALAASLLAAASLTLAGAALAQPPGGPVTPGCPPLFDLVEGTAEPAGEHIGPIVLPCPVFAGYVVLLDSPDAALQQDPHNWSDVVAFTTGGPVQPNQPTDHVFYISDSPDPTTNIENGITPADLAVAGLTAADIVSNSTTVYIVEGLNTVNPSENDYDVVTPAGAMRYRIFSDPPERPTPTTRRTWGRLKVLYR